MPLWLVNDLLLSSLQSNKMWCMKAAFIVIKYLANRNDVSLNRFAVISGLTTQQCIQTGKYTSPQILPDLFPSLTRFYFIWYWSWECLECKFNLECRLLKVTIFAHKCKRWIHRFVDLFFRLFCIILRLFFLRRTRNLL